MGAFFVGWESAERVDHCRDWRVVGLIGQLPSTTYKIHYVN
jgi:hypothetical protein